MDTRAFTVKIDPIGAGHDEDNSVHQVSPAWVLTFVRWANRDTLRVDNPSFTAVRDSPVVVENDCLTVVVNHNKGTLTHSVNAVLVMTDVNYATSIAPGDFMFVNMLNWDVDARRVADAARSKLPINGAADGFKGLFKVQSVRRVVVTEPKKGTTTVLFKITGFSHTEFNNTIYFNPYLIDPNQDPKNQLLFASYVGNDWKLLINRKGLVNVQDIIAVLIQALIGTGITQNGRLEKNGTLKSPNVHFFIPELVGTYLGIDKAKAAKDIYTYMFGIQNYAAGTATALSTGLNPTGIGITFGNFYYTPIPCDGSTLLKPEYWNQVKTWAILNQYTNSPLNELYTCFKISPTGSVLPTVVFRQIPFTSEDYSYGGPVTSFMTIPRWKINPALILSEDIGRDEAARINFVQYFGRSTLGAEGADIAAEIAQGNYLYDVDDVQRSGLRPYIVTTQFDDPTTHKKDYHSPRWAKIVGDALIDGHLKLNGSIVCAGVVDAISIGDNLELDGIVYHIEQVSHYCNYDPVKGERTFRTTISLSNGVSISSSENGTRFGEMNYVQAADLRKHDWANNQILPGVSETQDVVYRKANPDVDDVPPKDNPFIQSPNSKGQQVDDNEDDT